MLIVVGIIMLLLISSIRIIVGLSIVVVVGIHTIPHLLRAVIRIMLLSNCSHRWLRRHHGVIIAIRLLLCHFPLSVIVVVFVDIISCGNSRGSYGRRGTSVVERVRLVRVVMIVRIAILTVKPLIATIVSSGLGEESIRKSCTNDGYKTTNRSHNNTYITATRCFFALGSFRSRSRWSGG